MGKAKKSRLERKIDELVDVSAGVEACRVMIEEELRPKLQGGGAELLALRELANAAQVLDHVKRLVIDPEIGRYVQGWVDAN